jgi:hypothetical protein
MMVAGILLWAVATSTGTVDNIESFIEELFTLTDFRFDGGAMLEASAVAGAVLVLAGTAANVALTVLFNLISDLVGGIRVTVIEQETARRLPG